MAVRFDNLKNSILIVLYDYMLTSDHESFWFNIPAIDEALPVGSSGAFLKRALESLHEQGLIEVGGSDPLADDLYALTDAGISKAEELIEELGLSIEEYEPAPENDLILSRLEERVKFEEIRTSVETLKSEIFASNSFEENSKPQGDLIKIEVSAASELLKGERVRVSRLKVLLLPGLRHLAKTFGDKSIGEIATQLIRLLIGIGG